MKELFITGILLLTAGLSWYSDIYIDASYLDQLTISAFTLAVLYGVFQMGFIAFGSKRIKDPKSAYRYRKTITILFYLVTFLALFRIWIEDPQALLVSYGIVAAGATIALQDLIKNIAGGIVIVSNNLFRVGDRIEVEGNFGDVIDIGILNTTVFEIGNWVDGDQATGRIISIPNGVFLSKDITNYTGDHDYIWDELMIPITYSSDWKLASKAFATIAEKRTKDYIDPAKKQLKRLSRKFYIADKNIIPEIYVKSTDNWIQLHIRYITEAKDRRLVKSEINMDIMQYIAKSKKVSMASTTLDIIGFPK